MNRLTKIFWVAAAVSLGAIRLEAAEVSFRSGGESVSGYLALPAGAGRHPAIVVIHEWWGLNDWTRKKADKFAADGYVALAVDLYRGKSAGTDAGLAHELMRGLPEDRADRDLKAAFAYLATRGDVDPGRVGAIGWCMGGGYSLSLAVEEPKLKACVINYGHLVTDSKTIAKIQAPLLGNFGAEDRGIPPADVEAFEKTAHAEGKIADFKIYPGAGHGFASSPDPATFKAEAALDADARTDAFFAKYLKKK